MSLPKLAKEWHPLSVTGGIRHSQQRCNGSTMNSFYVCKVCIDRQAIYNCQSHYKTCLATECV